MDEIAEMTRKRYRKAKERRANWESHWQECYDYALPQRGGAMSRPTEGGDRRNDRLFDGTAADAVEQLAASLLAQLTPPWSQWFGLAAGVDLEPEERDQAAPILEKASIALQANFDRSNFAVEMHQCYLDLVTIGTASLLFEEAPLGDASAFRFTAIPMAQVALEEDASGRLDTTFRQSDMSIPAIKEKFPLAELPEEILRQAKDDPDIRLAVVESVIPGQFGYDYVALIDDQFEQIPADFVLAKGRFAASPFINFRWLKAPGEAYGRSPIMKALPDIKTANKVVELVLKNATISVTGIWQADDDGVLNPANIKLVPGTIIPKAVGSAGLRPLEAPGRFDVSQLVLEDLRNRIRHSLLADKLGQIDAPKMTATEIMERSAEMARLLGATFGRLQAELLTPLIMRAVAILRRRGEIPDLAVDGRLVDLRYNSPLAQQQARRDTSNITAWLAMLAQLGPEAGSVIDAPAAARWLARSFNIPDEVLHNAEETALPGKLAEMAGSIDPASLAKGIGAISGALGVSPGEVKAGEQQGGGHV